MAEHLGPLQPKRVNERGERRWLLAATRIIKDLPVYSRMCPARTLKGTIEKTRSDSDANAEARQQQSEGISAWPRMHGMTFAFPRFS
jgi:hypothetical protein